MYQLYYMFEYNFLLFVQYSQNANILSMSFKKIIKYVVKGLVLRDHKNRCVLPSFYFLVLHECLYRLIIMYFGDN